MFILWRSKHARGYGRAPSGPGELFRVTEGGRTVISLGLVLAVLAVLVWIALTMAKA